MSRKPDLELDLHEKIFDNDTERKELAKQMAQLSPRRAVNDGSFATMTLPFYEDISPSAAVEKLFKMFHTHTSGDDDEGGEGDGEDGEGGKPQEAITREEFNRLRRCVGKPVITEREWKRALEELGVPEGQEGVRKKDFKALFGPPPFFGSENVQGIVKYVMSVEEHLHFAKILLDRFGVEVATPAGVNEMMIGLRELQNIQKACCLDVIYGDAEWKELLKKLLLPETHLHLDWREFAESFTVNLKGKRVFGPNGDPPSVVYAVLANEKVLETIKDPEESIVSRKAFTNLLRLKQKKVDDEKWMHLLETMQTTYQYRKGRRPRKDSSADAPMSGTSGGDDGADGHGHDNPLVVVRNTRNQVLSYEITFDEHGEVGLELQSDFYGHCMTVAKVRGQAAKHSIIQKDDIVAFIDDESLTYDQMAPSKAVEKERVAAAMEKLKGDRVRKITFHRQESYFQYEVDTKTIHLFMKTLDEIPPDGKLIIQLPPGASWTPDEYNPEIPDSAATCLQVQFDEPKDEAFDFAMVVWNPSSETIEVTIPSEIAIEDKSFVVLNIIGLSCGDERLVGPCELVDGQVPDENGTSVPAHFVALHTDWKHRETTMQRNPIRDRVRRVGEYVDKALEPICLTFERGESGITLASDFFGQCATIAKVKEFSHAASFGLQPHDILTSIAVVGENDSLDYLNCIKPFALSKNSADAHIRDVRKRLEVCHKSNRTFRLQFLRLNAHFFHDKGRTIFTMNALTTLRGGSTLVVKMPSTKWHVSGPLTATIVDPTTGAKIKEVFWDSQQHTVHMVLDNCSIAESTSVVIEIQGISSGNASGKSCGPGEVMNVFTNGAGEMEFELHEHWHSFVVGHQGLEASKVIETLKDFDTNPSKLWDVLEYTSQLFDMYKASESEYLTLENLNRLIKIVVRGGKAMSTADWNKLCRNMGAKPLVGLSRRQFACCWYDVVGLSGHNAKDIYVRLSTADRLFHELMAIYQDEDEQEMILEETIERFAKFAGFPEKMKKKALKDLKDKGLLGWDCDTFSQIVCGSHPVVEFKDNAIDLWIRLYYSKKLFAAYNTKKLMRKKNMSDLLAAARVTKPKLTNELWTEVCDSVGIDDTGGLKLPDFLDVYAGELLGSRHAVADWYRIETFKLLPERRGKEEVSKEAVLNIAPEKVNVKDIASKVLEETASAEELFQDLLEKGLEFSKKDTVIERETDTQGFRAGFLAKKSSRAAGFLNIQIKSISELADRILQQDSDFNRDGVAEELYVLFEVTNAQGLKPRLPVRPTNTDMCDWAKKKLFGEPDSDNSYVIMDDELWDQGETQTLMRAMHDAEKVLRACKMNSPEYYNAYAKLKEIEKQLTPPPRDKRNKDVGGFDGRIFSSLILRDPSPDAITRFPDDQFRLHVDLTTAPKEQLYLVCKLFKRIGSAVSRLQLDLQFATDALKKAESTLSILHDLVEQQQDHLRHVIAEEHRSGKDHVDDSSVWTNVSKLKQKRQDLADFEIEVNNRRAEQQRLASELEKELAKQQNDMELLKVKPDTIVEVRDESAPAQTMPGEPEQFGAPTVTAGVPPAQGWTTSPEATTSETPGQVAQASTTTVTTKENVNAVKKQLEKTMVKHLSAQKVKFVGQAFFELGDLLNVLHTDKEYTDDLAVLRTETHDDVGVVLLHFQYKCASLQMEAPYVEMPTINMVTKRVVLENDKEVLQSKTEVAYQYPSTSHLELDWAVTEPLKQGDRLCLFRESEQDKNMNMPFFLVLWDQIDASGKSTNAALNDEDAADKATAVSGGQMNWWIPDLLAKVYSPTTDKLVNTHPSKRRGVLHLPSSIDLSLPPGTYRVYLLRNETDDADATKKYRTTLGKSAPLTVMPGINSGHTSFGTTPLIDVKPLSATLQVFLASERDSTMTEASDDDSYRDEGYLERIALEQELEVTKNELRASLSDYEKVKGKKEGKALEEKIAGLKKTVEDLSAKKLKMLEAAASLKDVQIQHRKLSGGQKGQNTVITSSELVVFSYRFHGGAPSPQDRIMILPADVVRVSDHLRSTILGKLQANDPQQVEMVRSTLERELLEVEEFVNMRLSFKTIKKIVKRKIKPYLTCSRGAGAAEQSDAYKAATGATDGSFVWDECLNAYNNASKVAKECFPYIIRDLLDEVCARKSHLGLPELEEDPAVAAANSKKKKKDRLAQITKLMKVGLEIMVPTTNALSTSGADGKYVSGEVSCKLGNRFRQGGFYVAKYVRRAAEPGGGDHTAGEICRYGPFFVEPQMFSFSPKQVAFFIGKSLVKLIKSDEGKLALKVIAQFYLSLIKYFLAVVSLSFNISVLAGNFNIDFTALENILQSFQDRLATLFGPIETLMTVIYEFFSGYIQELMDKLNVFDMAGECVTGFFLYVILLLLFSATFIVYVVVQEDLLLKVQKLHTLLPFNPGKSVLGFLEQIGALLVIPMYLSIKSCVLFISGQWSLVYHRVNNATDTSAALAEFGLYDHSTATCPDVDFAMINYGFGIAALILIVAFLFVCLPLLLLDLFSWVPLSELEDKKRLQELAHSYDRVDIKAAVHSNADLIEVRQYCPTRCLPRRVAPCFGKFKLHYEDYTNMAFRDLLKKYGIIGLFTMFVNIYAHLMLQSMGRSLGVLLGFRLRDTYMYKNERTMPKSRWRVVDKFCLRFNVSWKVQYIKDKIIMPFVNIVMVTVGLWGEPQWKEFNVEERANDCYRMEPSGEIKQLQMMTLHGKIISLFWLCIPETMVLAYLAEVLNRGPVFSYFLNSQFLQADIPESEREKDPVWRFHSAYAFKGEDDVVYLSDTRFMGTLLKWMSSIVEIVSLLMVYGPDSNNRQVLLMVTLISAVVTPILEFNQMAIKAYMDFAETAGDLMDSTGITDVADKVKSAADAIGDAADGAPELAINIRKGGRTRRGTAAPKATHQPQSRPGGAPAPGPGGAPIAGVPVPGAAGAAAANGAQGAAAGAPAGTVSAPGGAPAPSSAAASTSNNASDMLGPGITTFQFGGSDFGDGFGDISEDNQEEEEDEEDEDEEEEEEEEGESKGDNQVALASLVEATDLIKPKKELILLKAMPEVSYVVLTDALDVGEGEITINWQVNARQRFHALDAIGMFPARAPGDFSVRTMEDCICYRLLKDKDAEPFGWNPKSETEDAERELIMRQAKSLRDISERAVTTIRKKSVVDGGDEGHEERLGQHRELLTRADSTMQTIMHSPKLKPIRKKLSDMLEEEVIEHKLHLTSPRTSRMFSNAAAAMEEAAKKVRKIVNGQAKFRPANSSVNEDDPLFETFVYGNDAGIYQSKYGLHGFEFCYLRYNDPDGKIVGMKSNNQQQGLKPGAPGGSKEVKPGSTKSGANNKVSPQDTDRLKNYEILERFVSNEVQIGTFNIFMNLTCDRPLVGAKETLNLSWIIYGVAYSVLSNPKSRNCLGFYRVDGSNEEVCEQIEIIPTSAYLQSDDNEPCPGRMTVTTPDRPGVYEIRFLFNFFKKAQLHRECQVFGELEDEMQQLRIRSFYEKRTVAEELRKFSLREPKLWGIARMNTFAWLKAMLLSTLREPVKPSVIENTTDYADFLFGRLKKKLQVGLESPSKVYQRRIAQIVAPLRMNSFISVLTVALQSSSQMNDQLASITFLSPTEEDERKRGLIPARDAILLPSDNELLTRGTIGFRMLARSYLSRPSVCGFHDYIDDLVLNNGQLCQTLDQLMNNLSSSCVALYESAIQEAVGAMMVEAETMQLTNALKGIDVMLADLCRNHVQSIIRSFIETDCRTGMRWPGVPQGAYERLIALRTGIIPPEMDVDSPLVPLPQREGGMTPVTREYIAVRRWIRPKLEMKIITIFKQRHSRLMSDNMRIATQLLKSAYRSCFNPGLSLVGNPFPDHRRMRTESPLYFLEETRNQNDTTSTGFGKVGKADDASKGEPVEGDGGDEEDNNNEEAGDDETNNAAQQAFEEEHAVEPDEMADDNNNNEEENVDEGGDVDEAEDVEVGENES